MKSISMAIIFAFSFLILTPAAMAENLIVINPFKVPKGQLEESIEFWEKARDFLKEQPGYISTNLHQSIDSDATYQLVNVAQWKSEESFLAASKKMRKYFKTEKIERIKGLTGSPSLYRIIRK